MVARKRVRALSSRLWKVSVDGNLHPWIRIASSRSRWALPRVGGGEDSDHASGSTLHLVKRSTDRFHDAAAPAREEMNTLCCEPFSQRLRAF